MKRRGIHRIEKLCDGGDAQFNLMDGWMIFHVVSQTLMVAQTAAPAAPANPAATPGIDARQARQEQRIDQGVASGQLNKRETRRLDREQGAINRAENKAKADGTVTALEGMCALTLKAERWS